MPEPPSDPSNEEPESELDSRGPAPPAAAAQAPDPVRRIALGVVVALVVLLFYHVLSDRVTPYSSHGTIETFLVQIAPQVAGPVVEVAATDDHAVERGQLLFRIDPEPYRIAVEAADAALAEAGQSVGASTAEVGAAQAEVTRRRADLRNVRLQVERVMPLVERDVLAATKGDEARSELAQAEAQLANAEAKLERARQSLGVTGEANARIRAAMAALDQARLDWLHTEIVAPSDGIVTNVRVAAGHYAERGRPVMAFLDVRDVWMSAFLREKQLGHVAPGNTVEIALDSHPGRVFGGRVESVGYGVATGRETVEGTLTKTQASSGWLRAPQHFPVRIALDLEPGGVKADGIEGIRLGSRGSVVVYTRERALLNLIAWLRIRLASWLGYVF